MAYRSGIICVVLGVDGSLPLTEGELSLGKSRLRNNDAVLDGLLSEVSTWSNNRKHAPNLGESTVTNNNYADWCISEPVLV